MRKVLHFLNPNYMLRNFKIRNKITITFSIMIFLFVALISYFSYHHSTNIITEKSIVYTLAILEKISNNIDLNLRQIDMTSLIITSNTKVLNFLEYGRSTLLNDDDFDNFIVETELFDVMYSRKDIESIFLFDKAGNQWNTVSVRIDMNFHELYEKSEAHEGKMVFLDTDIPTGAITAARLVRNMSIEPVGLLMINIKESSIKEVFFRGIEEMKGEVYVINEDNLVLSSTDSSFTGSILDKEITDNFNDASGYVIEKIKGEKHIIIYYPSNYNQWKYIAVIPLSAITSETVYIGKISIVAFCVTVILFILITYIVVSGITVPITNITQYMREAKIKEWSPKMNYVGNDEIAYLSAAFNEMVDRINNLIDELYEQDIRQKNHELQALQAQINPHFLYNTLEIVNCMALLRNAPEIGNMVKTLASIMRYSISFKEVIVPIEMEMQHLRNYMFIQTERDKDRLSVEYNIDERIHDSPILKLTLQPIAENAVIHAFKGIQSNNTITITGSIIDERIRICIIDNGVGMDKKAISRLLNSDAEYFSQDNAHAGIGVGNVNRRLKLTFGGDYGLKVLSEVGKGTTVEVWLPIEA